MLFRLTSLAAALFAATVIALPMAAIAGTSTDTLESFTLTGPGNSNVVQVSGDGGASSISGYAGRYQGQLAGQDINVFCVDLNHDINFGQGYQADVSHGVTDSSGSLDGQYFNGGLSSGLNSGYYQASTGTGLSNQQRADEVGYLIHNYDNATAASFHDGYDLTTNLTAVSLAIWDIESDGGDGLSSGSMVTDSGTASTYGGLVNQLEHNASAYDNSQFLDVRWIQSPIANGNSMQSFAYAAPVPEAKTGVIFALLIIAGLALLTARRKFREVENYLMKD